MTSNEVRCLPVRTGGTEAEHARSLAPIDPRRRPRRGGVHLLRHASVPGRREGGRRLRGVQEPSRIPAAQRQGACRSGRRPHRVRAHKWLAPLPDRRTPPGRARSESRGGETCSPRLLSHAAVVVMPPLTGSSGYENSPRRGGITHNAERGHRSDDGTRNRVRLPRGGSGTARRLPRCGQAFHGVGVGGEQQVLDPGWVDVGDVDLGQAQLHGGELDGFTGQP